MDLIYLQGFVYSKRVPPVFKFKQRLTFKKQDRQYLNTMIYGTVICTSNKAVALYTPNTAPFIFQ